jgi:hypothetical protein
MVCMTDYIVDACAVIAVAAATAEPTADAPPYAQPTSPASSSSLQLLPCVRRRPHGSRQLRSSTGKEGLEGTDQLNQTATEKQQPSERAGKWVLRDPSTHGRTASSSDEFQPTKSYRCHKNIVTNSVDAINDGLTQVLRC